MTDTETIGLAPDIEELVRSIDVALADISHRNLISTDEMSNLLLDIRRIALPIGEG